MCILKIKIDFISIQWESRQCPGTDFRQSKHKMIGAQFSYNLKLLLS